MTCASGWDPQKLAAHNMTAIDVATAIRGQNIQAARRSTRPAVRSAADANPFSYPSIRWAASTPAGFRHIVVKVERPRAAAGNMAVSPGPTPAMGRYPPPSGYTFGSPLTPSSKSMGGGNMHVTPSIGDRPPPRRGPRRAGRAATTTSPAPSTASRRSASPSSSSPAPTPWTSPTAVRAQDGGAEEALPRGLDYEIVYDTTPFIRESVDEVFKTLRDAVILVAIVVLLFLQDWRAHDPADDRRARVADRHLRGHGGSWASA